MEQDAISSWHARFPFLPPRAGAVYDIQSQQCSSFCCFYAKAIHDPIETDDSWINGRSCESISAENNSAGENDDTDWDNRRIACGMIAQVN